MKTYIKKNNITVIHGDIFNYISDIIKQGNNGSSIIVPHVCNNSNVFGAGFATGVSKHFPIVKENYHLLGSKQILGHTQFITVFKDKIFNHQLIFANMIAQNNTISPQNPRPINYLALCKCMSEIDNYIRNHFDKDTRIQIHAPKFGCGLAGGNWFFIQNLIEDIWYKYNTFIYQI